MINKCPMCRSFKVERGLFKQLGPAYECQECNFKWTLDTFDLEEERLRFIGKISVLS